MKLYLLAVADRRFAIPALTAWADEPIVVHLKNHKFTPSTIKVKANKPSMILLYNDDDSADEFELLLAEDRARGARPQQGQYPRAGAGAGQISLHGRISRRDGAGRGDRGMISALIIVFREVIEAGLIVGIVLAATTGVPGRARAVALGVRRGCAGRLPGRRLSRANWPTCSRARARNCSMPRSCCSRSPCSPGTMSGWPAMAARWRAN